MFDLIVEGIIEDVVMEPTQEDWDWFFANTYVDPNEAVMDFA
jgi:hypothetical protein